MIENYILDTQSYTIQDEKIKEWIKQYSDEKKEQERIALQFEIKKPYEEKEMDLKAFAEENDANLSKLRAVTRLGEETISIILLENENNVFKTSNGKELFTIREGEVEILETNEYKLTKSLFLTSLNITQSKYYQLSQENEGLRKKLEGIINKLKPFKYYKIYIYSESNYNNIYGLRL